ncbi:MAG: hypothetical protein K8R90_07810 [Candidatus Cloacimonetes bacterium]|nr:hypothetical protein [Candidatus Cloacimonadota bacterium]
MRPLVIACLLAIAVAVAAQEVPRDRADIEQAYRQRTGFEGQFWWFKWEDAVKQVKGPYMYETIRDTLHAREIGRRAVEDAASLLNLGSSELRLHKIGYIPEFDQYNIFFKQYLGGIQVQPHGQLIIFIKEQRIITFNNSCISSLSGYPVAELNANEAFSVFADAHSDVWEASRRAEAQSRENGDWQPRDNPLMMMRISPLNIEGSGVERAIGDLRQCYILDLYGVHTVYFLDADTGEIVQEITRL